MLKEICASMVNNKKKFINTDEYKYIAIHKITGKKFFDPNNVSGALIRYIAKNNKDIVIPSKYDRSVLYKKTNNYWHEEYFNIIKTPIKKKRGECLDSDIIEIVNLYKSGKVRSTHKLSEIYKINHKRVGNLLRNNGVTLNNKNDRTIYDNAFFEKYKNRFKKQDGFVYKAIHKETGVVFDDYLNISGSLTRYIIKNDIGAVILRLESQKKRYFIENDEYWYEQYFDIKKYSVDCLNLKKCPYCCKFIDSSVSYLKYKNHIIKNHQSDIVKHIELYPNDFNFFKNDINKINESNNSDNWVFCKICGKKLKHINDSHLKKHGITASEYRRKYGCNLSINYLNIERNNMIERNKSGSMFTFVSKPEIEIKNFLKKIGISGESNSRYLIRKEINFLSQEYKIGIEFNGNKWHSEWFGKKGPKYHLNKTIECNRCGFGLIHIFEDEFHYKKDILFHKLKHIFGKDYDLQKIAGRKCHVSEISKNEQNTFLNKYHIQGSSFCTVSVGAYYNEKLVAVMSFKKTTKNSDNYELVRFASDYNYQYQGVASKILSYFIRNYSPSSIISFADRRWTLNCNDNLYTRLGFNLIKTTKPDYKYYNNKIDKYQRFHKFNFRKGILSKKYGLPLEWTETEMVKHLGYDRIWDCGLFKYELLVR